MDRYQKFNDLVSNFNLKNINYLEIINKYTMGITCTTQWRNAEGKYLSLK